MSSETPKSQYGLWARLFVAVGFPASAIEMFHEALSSGVDVSSVLQVIVMGIIFGYFWLPDKDGNRVPDVLDALKVTTPVKKYVLPFLLALAASLGIAVTGCSGASQVPDEPIAAWNGGTVEGAATGSFALDEGGEWHGDGSARIIGEGSARVWLIHLRGSVWGLLGGAEITIGAELFADFAKVVEVGARIVCTFYFTGEETSCEWCTVYADQSYCQPFGAERDPPATIKVPQSKPLLCSLE